MPKRSTGCLRMRKKDGREAWIHYHKEQMPGHSKKVEIPNFVGYVESLPTKEAAWIEVGRLGLDQLTTKSSSNQQTFGSLAAHWLVNDLEKPGLIGKRAEETIKIYVSELTGFLIPKWGDRPAIGITPTEVEEWFEELATNPDCRFYPAGKEPPPGRVKKPQQWTSIAKIKSVMGMVYAHGMRHKLIPAEIENNPIRSPKEFGGARCISTSNYDATVVSTEQMVLILDFLNTERTQMEWMMALLHAVTGLRGEEAFALRWKDINWTRNQIHIKIAWSKGKQTEGKNKHSMTSIGMHLVLATALQEWRKKSPYAGDDDWVFPSVKLRGAKPRSASSAAKDFLRPAAVHAGVILAGSKKRFGWHNLRHSLSEYLAGDVDPVVIMKLFRQKTLKTLTNVYIHRLTEKQKDAQGAMLSALDLIKPQDLNES